MARELAGSSMEFGNCILTFTGTDWLLGCPEWRNWCGYYRESTFSAPRNTDVI